jgi:hypothetical protein
MASLVSGSSSSFSLKSIGGTWQWSVSAVNNRGTGQYFEVRDIQSPFGPLDVVASPIPGDVIVAMSDAILAMQQQLNPQLYVPGSTSFSLTVTEGGSTIEAAIVSFQNSGAFGSFLTATATPDAPWLSVTPTSVVGVDKNSSGQFKIYVKPSSMLATSSPYTGHVNIQDNRNPPTIIPVTFNVTVLPRPAISLNASSVTLSWYLSTSSSFGPQTLRVTNSGPVGSFLDFSVAKIQNISPWLFFAPASAGPVPSTGYVDVSFSVVGVSVPPIPGTYSEMVRISSLEASNSPQDITVSLIVNP